MHDYDLSRLGTHEFETLVQALAIKKIGPGVTIFGSGPDGGREATYSGRMAYPSTEEPWDGYMVLQCKAKERPSGDTTANAQWAVSEFKKELEAWASKPRTRLPEYFIAVTNVVLSPVAEKGGKDRLDALLSDYAKKLGFKGYRIWDYDQICRDLDTFPEVRTAYAYILPGDVLAILCQQLASKAPPEFESTMATFLQSEFLADARPRMELSGHPQEASIPLSAIFTDLPATKYWVGGTGRMGRVNRVVPGVLASILIEACRPLGVPDEAEEQPANEEPHEAPPGRTFYTRKEQPSLPGRCLLIGGPGQGKSTTGQFLCQLHRAAILKDRMDLSMDAERLLHPFLKDAKSLGIDFPATRRFPIRMDLADLASKLAKDEELGLLGYLSFIIRRHTSRDVSRDVLRAWMGIHPWLIVLDGLDEIPPSYDRNKVIRAVQDFLVITGTLKVDLFLLITTRPQGYNDEFSSTIFVNYQLSQLEKSGALSYARRLCDVRFGHDKLRADRTYEQLASAAEELSPLRLLLRTPLQVSMLVALVSTTGSPPQQRWALFDGYYRLLVSREKEKQSTFARLLDSHQRTIQILHQLVALRLQSQQIQATAGLSVREFRALVEEHLRQEGYEEHRRASLVEELVSLALQRLVFLVEVQQDRIGFEIRSLQEFFAAEGLLAGKPADVEKELTRLAQEPYWKQVFLFACAHCFAIPYMQQLRDWILFLCELMDDSRLGEKFPVFFDGSRLALDLLQEGVAEAGSGPYRELATRALRSVALPPDDVHLRLADIYEESLKDLFRQILANAPGKGAWALLLALLEKAPDTFESLADERWEHEKQRTAALAASRGGLQSRWAVSKFVEILPQEKPWLLYEIMVSETAVALLPPWVKACLSIAARSANPEQIRIKVQIDARTVLEFRHWEIPLQRLALAGDVEGMPQTDPSWVSVVEAIRFARAPSATTLATSLRRIDEAQATKSGVLGRRLPWQLVACLYKPAEVARLSAKASTGDLGDQDVWEQALLRWKSQILTREDVLSMNATRWPYDRFIGQLGFPLDVFQPLLPNSDLTSTLQALLNLYKSAEASVRSIIGGWILELLEDAGMNRQTHSVRISPGLLREFFENKATNAVNLCAFFSFSWPSTLNGEWIDFFDWLGTWRAHFKYYTRYHGQPLAAALSRAYMSDPSKRGLLRVLAMLALEGVRFSVEAGLLKPLLDNEENFAEDVLFIRLASEKLTATELQEIGQLIASSFNHRGQVTLEAFHLLIAQRAGQEHCLPLFQGMVTCTKPELHAALRQRLASVGARWRTSEKRAQGIPE